MRSFFIAMAALLLPTGAAHAYIGPGLGAGAVAVVLGILASIGIAFMAILWYPLKRLFKKGKQTSPETRSKR